MAIGRASAKLSTPPPFGGGVLRSAPPPFPIHGDAYSPFVVLTPFLDQTALWNQISKGFDSNGDGTIAGVHERHNDSDFVPFRTQIPTLLCPSDGAGNTGTAIGDTNYAINLGDNGSGAGEVGNDSARQALRGMFARNEYYGFRDARDGTVNTLLFAEFGRDNGDRAHQAHVLQNVSALTVLGADPAKPAFPTPPPAWTTRRTPPTPASTPAVISAPAAINIPTARRAASAL